MQFCYVIIFIVIMKFYYIFRYGIMYFGISLCCYASIMLLGISLCSYALYCYVFHYVVMQFIMLLCIWLCCYTFGYVVMQFVMLLCNSLCCYAFGYVVMQFVMLLCLRHSLHDTQYDNLRRGHVKRVNSAGMEVASCVYERWRMGETTAWTKG